jgi:hypothetical protein
METKKPNSLIKNILAGLLAILMIIGIKALTYRPRSGDREQERERTIAAGKKWLEKMESPEAKKILSDAIQKAERGGEPNKID